MSNRIIKIEKLGFQWKTESPYLAVMHHVDTYPAGNEEMGPAVSLEGRDIGQDFSWKDGFSMYHGETVPGFPAHPHRGFETVTIMKDGFVDHFDSMGAFGRYGNGDVQWLTTGKGVQHAEMFPLLKTDSGNRGELFQIWLNLEAKNKMVEPEYKMLWSEDIPVIEKKGNKIVRLINGTFEGIKGLEPTVASWAREEKNNMRILDITLEPNGMIELPKASETINRNLYFYEGDGAIIIDGREIPSGNRVKLNGSEAISINNTQSESKILLLEGEPINEPVAMYGPFVMNTKEEIIDTARDYRETEFGGWPWTVFDPVNPREMGRFASYANGKVDKK